MHYFLLITFFLTLIEASHYLGGAFTWKPVNPTVPNQNPVAITFTQRHNWRNSYYYCDQTTINSAGTIGAGSLCCVGSQCGSLGCPISAAVPCTDFSVSQGTSSGQASSTINVPPNALIALSFTGSAWITLQTGGGNWAVTAQISTYMRADGTYNTAPVSAMVPIKLLRSGYSYTWLIPTTDTDGDTVRCRWATATASVPNSVVADECAGICDTFPGATLNSTTCIMSYTASTVGFWGVSLMIEDFEFVWQTTPLSSTPLQFLIQVYQLTSSCTVGPSYTGLRSSGACIGVNISQTIVEQAIFLVGCSGVTLTDVQTTSPPGMTRSAITQSSSNPLQYFMNMTWTPPASASGSNLVCYTPTDSLGQQGNTVCVTYLVGVDAPEFIYTSYVNGTMLPIGTVLSNQSNWRIECNKAINRPSISASIRFYLASNNTQVYSLDASIDTTHVIFSNSTLIFYTQYTWTPGQNYYILFDSGVVTGTEYCGPESAAIVDPTFWEFTVFNSVLYGNITGLSTSTSTTYIPSTTTAPISTTTANAGVITSGIPVANSTTLYTGIGTNSTIRTTTTSVTTTSTSTSTTSTSSTSTNSGASVVVVDPSDLIQQCQQPIIIGAFASTAGVGIVTSIIFGVLMAKMAASML